MWKLKKLEINNGYRFSLKRDDKDASYQETLEAFRDSDMFRSFFISFLQTLPFNSFRWETCPFSNELLQRQFEFVVLDAPSIDRLADSTAFQKYIGTTQKGVVSFPNLGKDAHMVVPTYRASSVNYCHLASFSNTAPNLQQHEFWQEVGAIGLELVTDVPLWLSTAGAGVAWLHIRFDSSPKYYKYSEFKGTHQYK